MHAARNQIVPRAFGGGLREHRRFDLEKAVLVEVLPGRHRGTVAQDHVPLHARAAQIQIAVLQPRILRHRPLVCNGKRRCSRLVQQPHLPQRNLHFARCQLRVDGLGRAALHAADRRDHVFRAEPLDGCHDLGIVARHYLGHAVPVPDVEERNRAEVAQPVHPSKQDDVAAGILDGELAAGMGARERA